MSDEIRLSAEDEIVLSRTPGVTRAAFLAERQRERGLKVTLFPNASTRKTPAAAANVGGDELSPEDLLVIEKTGVDRARFLEARRGERR